MSECCVCMISSDSQRIFHILKITIIITDIGKHIGARVTVQWYLGFDTLFKSFWAEEDKIKIKLRN